uniref:Cytochrome P450 302a1, mitochondrial n=1 Tax=Graphocephala atropunctata TaxID=36148 RepID=A0A1B6KHD3_9HEMI
MEALLKFIKHRPAHGQLSVRFLSCPVESKAEDKNSCDTENCLPQPDQDKGFSEVKSFKSIPGPKSYPVIGTLWKYIPLIGEYKFDRLHENGLKKLQQFGPLVREDIVPGVPVVWVYTPSDIERVYRSEGRFPERRSHLALKKYRKDRPHIYNNGGVLLSEGAEWWRLRSVFQRNLNRIQDVRSHLSETDAIMREFIQFAARSSDITDFLPKLSRLYLELTGMVTFSTRLQSFSIEEQDKHSVTSQLIEAAFSVNSCILKTDNGPRLWQHWRTPLYHKMEKSLSIIEKKAMELMKNVRAGENASLVSQYLTCPELDQKDIYTMAIDIMLAAIDTTTYTSCFVLYHLATNPEAQERLHQEACQLLPSPQDCVSGDVLARASITRSIIKETFRLNPVSVGIGRILAKDTVLSGYNVPSGTVVVTQNQVTCRLEEFFPRPNEFIPERWLRGSPGYQPFNPYLVLPFGHGTRACIARYLAEQNLYVLILRLIRDYVVTWHGGKLGVLSVLINRPDQPVLLALTKRGTSSS